MGYARILCLILSMLNNITGNQTRLSGQLSCNHRKFLYDSNGVCFEGVEMAVIVITD